MNSLVFISTIVLSLVFISTLFILFKINFTLNKNLADVRGDFSSHLSTSQNTLNKITENLTLIKTSSERILEAGKDIKSLEDLLKPPKLRGEISEIFLEQILAQVLPSPMYKTQHKFPNGNIVDAVIELKNNKLLCIDAKFPLSSIKNSLSENGINKQESTPQFIRDVKKHIEDIAKKYIQPEEGTLDCALMYIPAENIYYEIILQDEKLANHARERHVIPVSPNSLYSYLSVIFLGLKGFEIEKNSKQVLEQIHSLKINLENFLIEYEKLGSHLTNAKSKYDSLKQHISEMTNRLKNFEVLEHK